MLGEQRPKFLLGLARDGRGDPLSVGQLAQAARAGQRVALASHDDARVVEQLFILQLARQLRCNRPDVNVDAPFEHLAFDDRKGRTD